MNNAASYTASQAGSSSNAGAFISELIANMPIVLFVTTLRAALKGRKA